VSGLSLAPHSPQNFCSGELAAPQDGQARLSRAPHSPQNFRPEGFSWWQLGHFMTLCLVPNQDAVRLAPSAHPVKT
jgi:hypothetical protein